MYKKVNLYEIDKKIDELRNMGMLEHINGFRAIDYREFIAQPLEAFEMIWKYEGAYFKNPGDLFEMAQSKGYVKQKRAFIDMLKNPDRQPEMWTYKIQLIYASFRNKIGYYSTCEGWLLTKNSLSWVRANPYNSYFETQRDNERIVLDRAIGTYKIFVDPAMIDKPFHIDGFYGNCGVDNLLIKVNNK